MKTVLRNNPDNSISHVYFCTSAGKKIYLTKEARDRLIDLGPPEISKYYSGDAVDEVVSLRDDLADILCGDMSVDRFRLSIARSTGFIKEDEIIEESNESEPQNPMCKKYTDSEVLPDENGKCSLCGGDCTEQ